MLKIVPIPALHDNYIWAIIDHSKITCVIVDPGEASPVNAFLEANNLGLNAILLTHHHWDHTSGVGALTAQHKVQHIYGPANPNIEGITHHLKEGDNITLDAVELKFTIAEIPGHTLDHIAYINNNHIFCGDTLFAGGCGRLFEGTASQMYQSLKTLTTGLDETKLYPAHEYTVANLNFAKKVEPENQDIIQRLDVCTALRQLNKPTLPTTIAIEKATNPFVRAKDAKTLAIIRQEKDKA